MAKSQHAVRFSSDQVRKISAVLKAMQAAHTTGREPTFADAVRLMIEEGFDPSLTKRYMA